MTSADERPMARWSIALLELVLLGGSIAMMWWRPLGDSFSMVVASAMTIVFLSLLPILVKGSGAAQRESELVRREFSGEEERDKFRR